MKNKVAPPFRQAEFDILYGEGVSREGSLLDLGIEYDIVTKSGSYFSFGDDRLGQGRNASRAFLIEHTDIADEIERRIRDAAGINPVEDLQVDPTTGEVLEAVPAVDEGAEAQAA